LRWGDRLDRAVGVPSKEAKRNVVEFELHGVAGHGSPSSVEGNRLDDLEMSGSRGRRLKAQRESLVASTDSTTIALCIS